MAEQERLSAAQRSRIRRLSAPKELAADEEGGELNIVPFLDIITNVMMFVLATVSVTFMATTDHDPPKLGGAGPRPPTVPTLGLAVLVVPDGFSLKARGGNVAPGCADMGPGLAIAKAGGAYDYTSLTACARKLKGLQPDFADEMSVTLSANPNIPVQVLVSTMDALRKVPDQNCDLTADSKNSDKKSWTGAGCLFPEVQFGLAR